MSTSPPLAVEALKEEYQIAKFNPEFKVCNLPGPIFEAEFYSISRSKDELSGNL